MRRHLSTLTYETELTYEALAALADALARRVRASLVAGSRGQRRVEVEGGRRLLVALGTVEAKCYAEHGCALDSPERDDTEETLRARARALESTLRELLARGADAVNDAVPEAPLPSSPSVSIGLLMAGGARRGEGRARLEDTFLLGDLRGAWRLGPEDAKGLVEDGVAAVVVDVFTQEHPEGERLARRCAGVILERLRERPAPTSGATWRTRLEGALVVANRALTEDLAARRELRGAGAVVQVLVCEGGRAHFANLGGGGVFLQRGGRLERLTRDDTLQHACFGVEPEGEPEPPMVRALGIEGPIEPYSGTVGLCQGDALLVCSDGVDLQVDGAVIERALDARPAEAVRTLLELAARVEGGDDATAVVLRVRPEEG